MAGYSYFDYDQMTLLGIEVHSDELELLQQAADTYDWEIIESCRILIIADGTKVERRER